MKNNMGGARPGAGRKKGGKNRETRIREAAQRRAFARAIERRALTAEQVLEEMRCVAFSDLGACFDEQGNLKPLSELSPEARAAIAGTEVVIKNAQAGDGVTDRVHKIKLWDKLKALEMLAKHFDLLKERVDLGGTVELVIKKPWDTASSS